MRQPWQELGRKYSRHQLLVELSLVLDCVKQLPAVRDNHTASMARKRLSLTSSVFYAVLSTLDPIEQVPVLQHSEHNENQSCHCRIFAYIKELI